MSKPEAEEDWEYCSEDGDDYEWEYSEEEAEVDTKQAAVPEPTPETKPAPVSKPIPEEKPVPASKPMPESKPATRSRPVRDTTELKARNAPEVKSSKNSVAAQIAAELAAFKASQAEEEEDESDYEYESDEEEIKDKMEDKAEDLEDDIDLDEEDLEDLDIPDPFSTAPVPKVRMNGQNGSDEKKKDKKHKKKSRHHDKFEKFRKLEEKDNGSGPVEDSRMKKIHVRSKDPSKIAKKFEKADRAERDRDKDRGRPKKISANGKEAPRPKQIEMIKICKVCGKEPYLVEKIVAEKAWWHKNCFRCTNCQKILNLDTYASHQGVIYCKPHHKELFQPKRVDMIDLTEQIISKNLDFSTEDPIEKHRRQAGRHETIVRENKPVTLKGVVKSQVDDSKWEGLDELDVGAKFLMFEKGASEDREPKQSSDRYGIMDKLKRLQAGEGIEDLLAEIDDEMPSASEDDEEIGEEEDTSGLTMVQKKAHNAEKLFTEDSRKDKLAQQRKKELKLLRDKLMRGTRDTILDSFDELNHKKVKKTQVDVRSENAKKFMDMFNKGEIPEHISASDRITMEKEAELEAMRSKKRGERDFFKKMENGELETKDEWRPKLLVGKLNKDEVEGEEGENGISDDAPLAKKFSFFQNYSDKNSDTKEIDGTHERVHAARECKARSVLNKFKDMEQKIANGEEVDDPLLMHKRPLRKFTPPRRLGPDSESEYSDSDDYSGSEYTDSDSYSSDESEEDEYIKNIKDAARAKELRAKFEEWEASVGEDGGYTNLVDENGQPLETAGKLKNRFERLAMEEETPAPRTNGEKFRVRRFKD